MSDLRKEVLHNNLQMKVDDIAQTYNENNKNRRRLHFPFGQLIFANPNFCIMHPTDESIKTVVLQWSCCQGLEPVFSDEMNIYVNRNMCSSCFRTSVERELLQTLREECSVVDF